MHKHNLLILMLIMVLTVCMVSAAAEEAALETKTLRIIGTSDLHGKFLPWDYALNEASASGSVAQLASAIARYRTENTLLVDAGDTIQDNASDIFVNDDGVHPMVQALNAIGYDVWVTGNHEYNFGMDITRKTIADMNCKVLVGNVYDKDGKPIADGYAIFDVDGVRVAVIGMVTPNIIYWDVANLAGCKVTDPLEETRAILDRIKGRYDVLVGVYHMGISNQKDRANSGVTDILSACPEFDVMVSSHEHTRISGMDINGVLVVQNMEMARTMAVVDLTLEKDGEDWKVAGKTSESIRIADFDADPEMAELLSEYDRRAREDAEEIIGRLEDGPLAPKNEIAVIPTALIEDTALIDLINTVQMYYAKTPVSATPLFVKDGNMQPGDIRRCDVSQVYKFPNKLYKLHMTGAQLKKYMECMAEYYNTFTPGDLTVSFNSQIRPYNYDMFSGVNYEVNIANEPGSRIENLTWPDGTPVKDEDEFDIAVSDKRANSRLLLPDSIFEADDMPTLLEIDVRGDIGSIRELIVDYIENVKGGTIRPECDHNWKITGYEWDDALRQKAVEMLAAGELTIPSSESGRTPNVKAITVDDVK